MEISVAKRLDGIGEYYFSQKLKQIDELNKTGAPVLNLGIGSPDLPPHPDVIRVLQEEAAKPGNHAYQSYKGAEALRKAVAQWYATWYGVELDPASEILPLIGSKEGILHICMTYLNEGDVALIPNPGYPTYRSAVQLAGGTCLPYELTAANNYFPDFEALEQTDLSRVKLMWVNYPQMPTGQLPQTEVFERLVQFGKKHNILICHDNPYSFILNDQPASMLAVDGAKEVVLELNSLSKSHNMAGWRVGFLLGAADRINEVLRFKSNMDSGMFLPLQLAAAKALSLDASWYQSVNEQYRQRRQKAYELLDLIGCTYSTDQAGMFIWAQIPADYRDGFAVSDEILKTARVFITPGGIFGSAGNGFIRVSLCSPIEKLDAAINRIKEARKVPA
ncbi:pyridoxal phosphate-dependent aminotransferase [Pseudocnuella soli]|uniref:pyridoxal phosphate-dependent aminotransferase n=1 Tax=Pseudocnuella soli TaxID=2502779 RepID=UPI001043845F|nr:aminotransferase class I/II-fold pyridoxal phosphate-dependent enzyme [Pseudocnuella soli]